MAKPQKKSSTYNTKKEKHKKGFFVLKLFLIIILTIAIAIGSFVAYSTYKNGWGVSGMIKTAIGHTKETVKNLKEFRVLILGVSTDISVKLTDTIMVASYNPQTQKVSLMSIPRDTFIGKNENTASAYHKINTVYQKGIDNILKTVNEITDLDIKYYVVVDTEALIKLVDIIGGVEFNVPIDMDYDDITQDLHIHLKAGQQLLDGEKAENLVRFRHNNDGTSYPASYGDNDTGRMRTQREFMSEVLKQTIRAKNITKIGDILNVAYEYVETNIGLQDAKDYIPYIIDFNIENMKTGTLPGVNQKINGIWFYKYDKVKSKEFIEELFLNNKENSEGTSNSAVENTNTSENEQKETQNNNSKVTVEIINGSGSSNGASSVSNLLKKEGYKISKITTTEKTKTTSIINNSGLEDTANDIKELIGKGIVLNSTGSSSGADITVIIGTNYNND